MSNLNHNEPSRQQREEMKAFEQELGPRLQELRNVLHEVVTDRAKSEGWSSDQAEWLDTLAQVPFFEAVLQGVPARKALDDALNQARQGMAQGYFVKALENGRSPTVAFLTLVELEGRLAERKGEPAPDYPDAWLQQAAAAVEAAAERGAPVREQIEQGFATLRATAEHSRVLPS